MNIVFQCINIHQVPREVLKTLAYGLGFQHLPGNLANVNAWKTMFDPYIIVLSNHVFFIIPVLYGKHAMTYMVQDRGIHTEVVLLIPSKCQWIFY